MPNSITRIIVKITKAAMRLNYKMTAAVFLLQLFSISFLNAQPLGAGKDKFIGNIIKDGNNIRSNFTRYWNQVTAENAGKWGSVEYTPGSYNWTQLDKIYNYSITNNLPYKHHCLLWGQQQPAFMASLDSAAQYQEIENWIKETGARYPDADMCEVVNEPLHAEPVYKNALGGAGATGWDWVIKAFELARKYWSPKTKLLINEYSVINSNSSNANYLKIINLLKERGLVDGIGVQGHNFEVNGGASTTTFKTNLDNLAATGLPVYITEFDISEADDNIQLQKYQSVFPVLFEHPGVKGITFWGYIQNEIWQTNAYLLTDRMAERPAMTWLKTYLASPFAPVLIAPLNTTDEPLTPTLVWHASESAKSYNVQISENRSFYTILIDTTVTDTLVQIDTLKENSVFYWRVSASNDKGTSLFSTYAFFVTKTVTGLDDNELIPESFALYQNYPNPFNPETTIKFSIPFAVSMDVETGHAPSLRAVSLKVYDILGREIATLVNENKSPGNYEIIFNSGDLPSGIYVYKLTAGNFSQSRKMILMK